MDKFFYYVFITLSILGFFPAIYFILASIFGKGNDPEPIICIAAVIGCLFESALCWTLARLLRYISLKTNALLDE